MGRYTYVDYPMSLFMGICGQQHRTVVPSFANSVQTEIPIVEADSLSMLTRLYEFCFGRHS